MFRRIRSNVPEGSRSNLLADRLIFLGGKYFALRSGRNTGPFVLELARKYSSAQILSAKDPSSITRHVFQSITKED